ncbi:hypothetical protein RDV84_12195 [Lysobacter yananisis]|uniref:Uncharacterized protein n=2 Tax=Lysobacter TaxID=68 RepID=A0A0S2DLD6_LYSEN|nr:MULTISPECIES: hypothetical protein [Lysobacter]ALN59499.1 hypothetical protein GLE_4157 [Lysobacter enzymogenes]QCW27644.1 hypothetical protein FE772_20385 [Lysobacter enzymogenes]WMT05567.1 hypothetical protein RDV84_12195 [Lysobacter yananisis]
MSAAGDARLRRLRLSACASLAIVCGSFLAGAAFAACKPADAALAGQYASGAPTPLSLRLDADGRFRIYDLPPPLADIAGCWQREGARVVFAPGADGDKDGIERVLPDPLTQADLDKVRGDGIQTLEQAVDAGLLPPARWWAHQPRKPDEPLRVKVFDPRAGIAAGETRLSLRLADGREIEASPGTGDGEFEVASLPASAAVTAIGVRFAYPPQRTRWVATTDSTKQLYLIGFDALAIGAIPGGPLALDVQADGSLLADPPDRLHFKRTP